MKLRAPAYPLITVDPYFSVWSFGDRLNEQDTSHWTGMGQTIIGIARINNKDYCFMGDSKRLGLTPMEQVSVDFDAFKTIYKFKAENTELTVTFFTPILPTSLMHLSSPVSYISVKKNNDSKDKINISISISEEICLNHRGQCPVTVKKIEIDDLYQAMRIGGIEQPVLGKSGDGICIDWGYFFIASDCDSTLAEFKDGNMIYVSVNKDLTRITEETVFVLAYDDIFSIKYFGMNLKAYWKKDGNTIEKLIYNAFKEYKSNISQCNDFSLNMFSQAILCGGEEYAELLQLSLRQVLAAHKLVLDQKGELLYISKECYSNGCAATVDVSYPSMPLFLLYKPELVNAMLRPIIRYAKDGNWPFDFAPHDVGTYPILNGQVYSGGTDIKCQMPIEECGNILLMVSAAATASKNYKFIKENKSLFDEWAEYLLKYGVDPNEQLCTDDFAGHLAHNCNLSLKAIMALKAYSYVCGKVNDRELLSICNNAAVDMAQKWVKDALNKDGSFALAFDKKDTFSMKYNVIWDKIFGTKLFDETVINREFTSYKKHMNPYGVPLDNRADYTKADWIVWVATLADSKEQFEEMIHPLWLAYNLSPSRVPMTDWYSTITSLQTGFQNRSVLGGLFIKLLYEKKVCKFM